MVVLGVWAVSYGRGSPVLRRSSVEEGGGAREPPEQRDLTWAHHQFFLKDMVKGHGQTFFGGDMVKQGQKGREGSDSPLYKSWESYRATREVMPGSSDTGVPRL